MMLGHLYDSNKKKIETRQQYIFGLIVAGAIVGLGNNLRQVRMLFPQPQDVGIDIAATKITHWNEIDDAPKVTHWNASNQMTPPTIYSCNGKITWDVWASVFPEYQQSGDLSQIGKTNKVMTWKNVLRHKNSNTYDIFIGDYNMGGYFGCSEVVSHWLLTNFHGHIVTTSMEAPHDHPFKAQRDNSRMHVFGPVKEPHNADITFYFMQSVWFRNRDIFPPLAMTEPSHRPRGDQTNYMIYANSHCVKFREEAIGRLSEHGIVHLGGKCQGKVSLGDRSNLQPIQTNRTWENNMSLYSGYRFCFVMENEVNHSAYITEKILMAFMGGCIPIYYGPPVIFDIFNDKAFIFYNISEPQPAIDKVKALESDKEAYEQMLMEPIVAHGNATIEKYFSLSDDVGKGMLKQRMREKIGLTNFAP
jgi:hypothetical protein